MADQAHPYTAPGPEPVRTIGHAELKAKLDRGDDIKLIMALPRWEFEAKHIPGSIRFDTPGEPHAAIAQDDEVIVYCSQVTCTASVALYWDLLAHGYQNVRRYAGGLLDWRQARSGRRHPSWSLHADQTERHRQPGRSTTNTREVPP